MKNINSSLLVLAEHALGFMLSLDLHAFHILIVLCTLSVCLSLYVFYVLHGSKTNFPLRDNKVKDK